MCMKLGRWEINHARNKVARFHFGDGKIEPQYFK